MKKGEEAKRGQLPAAVLAMLAVLVAGGLGALPHSFAQYEDTLAVLNTEHGAITIEFFPGDAPGHVDNFVMLAEDGFYDGTLFHRIIPGFMIQGGDPLTAEGEPTMGRWGTGGPERRVPQEFNDIKHVRGILSMARSADPDSAGSQFFIVHADSLFLDGQYTVFGRVATQESFEALDMIASMETAPGDKPVDWAMAKIISVDVVGRSDAENLLEQGPPARTGGGGNTQPPQPPASQQLQGDTPYRNEGLGIEFQAPVGWLVQEPEKTHPEVPDVVAITTTGTSPIPVSISVTIIPAEGRTLEQYADARRMLLDPTVESGMLVINSEGPGNTSGRDTRTIDATGTFPGPEGTDTDVRFTETTFLDGDQFFVVTYTASASEYETYRGGFEESIETFAVISSDSDVSITPKGDDSGDNSSGSITDDADNDNNNGCLIATAAYGSEMAPQVQLLREIRDNAVLSTHSGTAFMAGFNQFYYAFSPVVADWERQNPAFREAVRLAITPLITSLAILGHVEAGSEHGLVGYGIGVIGLNVGMYIVAPAAAVRVALGMWTRGRKNPGSPDVVDLV